MKLFRTDLLLIPISVENTGSNDRQTFEFRPPTNVLAWRLLIDAANTRQIATDTATPTDPAIGPCPWTSVTGITVGNERLISGSVLAAPEDRFYGVPWQAFRPDGALVFDTPLPAREPVLVELYTGETDFSFSTVALACQVHP